MAEVRITAEPRTEFGKGGARRTRRAGKVPAVLYGHGAQPRHISLPARELQHALRGGVGSNVLLRVDVDGTSELALPRQVQRDPLRGDLTHVDLLLVRRGEKVAVDITVHIVGESAAVRGGDGVLTTELATLHVEAEALHIPQSIDVDVTGLGVGESIHAGDVKLPPDVTLLTDPEATVLHIVGAASAEQVEAELAAAEADARGIDVPTPAETSVPEGEAAAGGPGDTRAAE